MARSKKLLSSILTFLAFIIIILDTKTAILGVNEGLQLCLQTVIPALFPFFILSAMLNSHLIGKSIGIFRPICKLCKIPYGSESLLLLGFLAGYPVGAQLITQAYVQGSISENTAKRMLGFCNNAGPAFLFGMLAPCFKNPAAAWVLWGIQIGSALCVGWILSADADASCKIKAIPNITLPQALQAAIKNLATVCGWIIVFRIILVFCQRWFLWLFPAEINVLFSGLLELSNGCVLLRELTKPGLQFVLASFLLSFGGLCVCMQTYSATSALGLGYYFPGKILQAILSVTMSLILQSWLFTKEEQFYVPLFLLFLSVIPVVFAAIFYRRKKVVAIRRGMLYNSGSFL